MPQSSPHPWGCFSGTGRPLVVVPVFPTPVGVFLTALTSGEDSVRLPHTRGGVSRDGLDLTWTVPSSPHPWGCFRLQLLCGFRHGVFPTPVGVFPPGRHPQPRVYRLPHTRGGVSFRQADFLFLNRVFPTPVGVFPEVRSVGRQRVCLPHTRGGVSILDLFAAVRSLSSPHPWGCFCGRCGEVSPYYVFPTPVGVFPSR